MARTRRIPKRTFANEVGKSPRTIERWIATGIIPNSLVFKDPTGHIFIHELAIDHIYEERRSIGGRYAQFQANS
jgi:hypothetical protein